MKLHSKGDLGLLEGTFYPYDLGNQIFDWRRLMFLWWQFG